MSTIKNIFKLALVLFPLTSFGASPYLPKPPRLPKFMAGVLEVDQARLQRLARDYEWSRTGQGTSEDFLFAYLPKMIFSALLFQSNDTQQLQSDLGLLYYSGVQGGVWLNRVLADKGGKGIGPGGLVLAMKLPALLYINNMCKQRLGLVQKGSPEQKRGQAEKSLDTLIYSYGYNKGYLLEILKHPPEGSKVPDDYLACSGMLDCSYSRTDLSLLDPVLSIREKIERPTGPEWVAVNKMMSEKLPGAEKRGSEVWSKIMADREFSPGAYKQLIDISAEFLVINEAIMLATASAIANQDEAGLSRALVADSALRVWLIGYMIGLGERAD